MIPTVIPFNYHLGCSPQRLHVDADFNVIRKCNVIKQVEEPYLLWRGKELPVFLGGQWSTNYYHWLYDCLADYLFVMELTGQTCTRAILHQPGFQLPGYVCDSIKWLGLEEHIEEYYDGVQHRHDEVMTRCNQLIFPNRNGAIPHWWAVRKFNELANSTFPIDKHIDVLLVQRAQPDKAPNRSRNLLNRDELITALTSIGRTTTIAYMEEVTFEQQVNLFRSARAIIFVTGTAGTNITFCTPETQCIEILTPDWSKPTLYAQMACAIDLPYIGIQGEYRTKVDKRPSEGTIVSPESHYNQETGAHYAPVWCNTQAILKVLQQSGSGPEIV